MTSPGRRRFLQLAGGAVAAAASGQVLPASIRRALQTPAQRVTGSIRDVEHVVILMQENRSFDHYFGTSRGVRGFSDPRPLQLPGGRPVWYQPNASVRTPRFKSRGVDADAAYVLPFHIDTRKSGDHQPGTDHGWSSAHLALNHGKCDQWITQKQDVLTMGYLRREDIPFHRALADAFTICDSYFCSVPADTAINRIYLWSGTCDPRSVLGRTPNGPPSISERPDVNGYTWTTYPERLEQAGIHWKLYQGGTGEPGAPTDNFTDNSLEFFANYQVAEGADPDGPLVGKGVSNHTLKELLDDVRRDQLPQVSWIVPPYKYSEHPEASAVDGSTYINLVLEALTANPVSWAKTALFLCYDENDGLFDHVVPPMPPADNRLNHRGMVSPSLAESLKDEFLDLDVYTSEADPVVPGADPLGLQPLGLGTRVPMIVISPWTTGGWVCSQTFDHTSILQFLEARFGVEASNISAWRRAVCGDLTSAFDFARQPDPGMPDFHLPQAHPDAQAPITVPADASMPVQEPGLRPARPIPYAWTLDPRLDPAAGKLWLDIANTGKAGAAFHAHDNIEPDSLPRHFTVAAGETLSDYWPLHENGAGYDVVVYGPNGYLCHVRGETATISVQLRHDPANCRLHLNMTNTGDLPRVVTARNAYHGPAASRLLAANASMTSTFELGASHGWYDLWVTLDGSSTYLRRHAGHLENGRPSTSDPGS